MLRQPSLSVLPVVALSPSNEAYHWEGPGHIQNVLTPTLLITHWLPMSSFDKNQMRKKTERKYEGDGEEDDDDDGDYDGYSE
jgi:hypothetical protein